MTLRSGGAAAAGLLLLLFATTAARAQGTVAVPDVSGDQLLFFYDARPGRVSFLNVSNPSSSSVTVEIAFYSQSLSGRLGSEQRTIPAAGNAVLDPSSAAGGSANGSAGLAVVTPIAAPGNAQPVVPPVPLTGGFTLANTALASAFGENALARLAVNGGGAHAAPGSSVDGTTVLYQRFTPARLMVPAYFDPSTLGAPENDGNRVVLVAFEDQYGNPFQVGAMTRGLPARFVDAGGAQQATGTANVTGVLLTNLQELAGGATLSGSGKLFLDADASAQGNLFGIFSQSLSTFASGQRLPAV